MGISNSNIKDALAWLFLHIFCHPCKLFLTQADNLLAATSCVPLRVLQLENEKLREVFPQVQEGAFLFPQGLTPREALEAKVWTGLRECFALILFVCFLLFLLL